MRIPPTARLVALALAVVVVLVAGVVAAVSRRDEAATATPTSVPHAFAPRPWPPSDGRLLRFRLAYGDPNQAVAEAPRFDLFVLNADASPQAARIRWANPQALVLVYKDLSFAADWDPTGISHGVGWHEASAHPAWFATDAAGARIQSRGWPGNYVMDVANPEYQQRWLSAVAAEVAKGGWDGVFVDDVNWDGRFAGATPARDAAPGAWRAATTTMLAVVGPALQKQHAKVVLNIGAGKDAPGIWQQWLPFADGAMEEHVGGAGSDRWTGADWLAQVGELRAAATGGKVVLAGLSADNGVGVDYGVATAAMAGAGRLYVGSTGDRPLPDDLSGLGPPTGPPTEVSPGVWRRNFRQGSMLVDSGAGRADLSSAASG